MAKTIAKILGVVFVLVGLCGFAAPGLLGTHLSPAHNLVHIVSGIIALYFGFAGSLAGAKMFDIVFGVVYLLLGVAGFAVGSQGMPSMPAMALDTHLLKLLPGVLEFGTMDHTVHILLGIVFLAGGLMTRTE